MKNLDSKIFDGQKHIRFSSRALGLQKHHEPNILSHTFIEDVKHRIFPYDFDKRTNVDISFIPNDKAIENKIISSICNRRMSVNKTEFIRKFLQQTIRDIFLFGHSIYEMIREVDDNFEEYKIVNISDFNVAINKGNVNQIIPKEANNEIKVVKIPKEKCFIFEFPKKLFNDFDISKLNQIFNKYHKMELDSSLIIKYFQGEIKNYDFTKHKRMIDLELCKILTPLSWTPRTISDLSEEKLIFRHYNVQRQLLFLRKIIELRGMIINFLQNIILSYSDLMGHRTELKIEGLTSLSDVDQKIKLWQEGSIDFKDIMDFFYKS